ncbi:MAG: flagellar assembly protein FliW, partial [Treponema sp.]|nr:flagellar assembly protein FliW [Treponema sp.]
VTEVMTAAGSNGGFSDGFVALHKNSFCHGEPPYFSTESPEDLVVMTIVTIPSDGSAITANFLGPVVINRKNNKCVQVVLNDSRWTTKFDIVASLKKGE